MLIRMIGLGSLMSRTGPSPHSYGRSRIIGLVALVLIFSRHSIEGRTCDRILTPSQKFDVAQICGPLCQWTCSLENSTLSCETQRCADPRCRQDEILQQRSSDCCPSCSPKSEPKDCVFNGRIWRQGSQWQISVCEKCECLDGNVVCSVEQCPEADCKEGHIPYRPAKSCCLQCIPLETSCAYDGVTYPNGSMWFPLDCVACMCINGKAECFVVDCPSPLFCNEEERLPQSFGKCCPHCAVKSCVHGLHKYEHGEMWQVDSCTFCVCNNGETQCQKKECSTNLLMSCEKNRELRIKQGECCPSCTIPGAHCLYNDTIYFSGDIWKAEKECEYCSCLDGIIVCRSVTCHPVICSQGSKLVHIEGQCCPVCELDQDICVSEGDKTTHEIGSVIFQDRCYLAVCFGRNNLIHFVSDQCQSSGLTACQNGFIHQGKCIDQCPAGFYPYIKQCRACAKDCTECFGGQENQCLKCKPHLLIYNGKCISSCPFGFTNSNGWCTECDPSCKTCSGPTRNECLSCAITGQVLSNGQCVDECQTSNSYIQNGQCLPCPPSCKTCAADSQTCRSCHDTSYLQEGQCQPQCNRGHYPSSDHICYACHPSCSECSGPLPTECTSCHRNHNLLNGLCVKNCGHGFYVDQASKTCKACHPSCNSCIGPDITHCLSCTNGFLLKGPKSIHGICYSICPKGYYLAFDGTCEACHPSCVTCNGPFSGNCTSCVTTESFFIREGFCVPDCGVGYYHTGNNLCQACHPACATCLNSGAESCLSCHHKGRLHEGLCHYPCGNGLYEDNDGRCKACPEGCLTCIKSSLHANPICTNCKDLFLLQGDACVTHCDKNYFLSQHKLCKPCHSSCASCLGKEATDCKGCSSSNVLTPYGQCATHCPPGYYIQNGHCRACEAGCFKCSGEGRCEQCHRGKVLQFRECIDACQSQFYLDPVTQRCKDCSKRCITCHGPSFRDCLSCKSRTLLERGTCVAKCSNGFYADGKHCKACHSSCHTCKTHLYCTSCRPPNFLLKGECVMTCGPGRFPDNKTFTCKICSANCILCENPAYCRGCKEGYLLQDGKCVNSCGQGFIADHQKRICKTNLARPEVTLRKPRIMVWPRHFVPVDKNTLTVYDPDTQNMDLKMEVVQAPSQAELRLYKNDASVQVMRQGDTFLVTELEAGQFGVYSKDDTNGHDQFSLVASDSQWKSQIIGIIIQYASLPPDLRIIQSNSDHVVVKGGTTEIVTKVVGDDDHINFTVVAGPKHGYLYDTSNRRKTVSFKASDLVHRRIHYVHDGSNSDSDIVLIQAYSTDSVTNKILHYQIIGVQMEASSEMLEYEKIVTFEILNHQEASTTASFVSSLKNTPSSATRATVYSALTQSVSDISESVLFFAKETFHCDEESKIIKAEIIRIGGDMSKPSHVWCSTQSSDPPSALPGKDFVPVFHKIEFLPWQTNAVCSVTILDDSADPHLEGNETLSLILSNPSGGILQEPTKAVIVINDTNSDVPVLQFLVNEIHVAEKDEKVEVPIVRSGDISFVTSVRCFTITKSAKSGKDFHERPNSEESRIYFLPQEEMKNCTIGIIDDKNYEAKEAFLVHLGSPQSARPVNAILGSINTMTVIISNEDDAPRIQFEKAVFSVSEPKTSGSSSKAILKIVRIGDNNKVCKFRVSTQDGTAISGVDYHARSQVIILQPKQTRVEFELEILYQEERAWNKMFTVLLGPGEPVNAEIGDIPVAAVHILDHEVSGGKLLPSPPLVVSLLFYDDVKAGLSVDPSPGYPLVCVTPCDSHHPDFSAMEPICKEAGIHNTSSVHFYWEVAVPEEEHGLQTPFQRIVDNTLFTSVESQVLDSIYFRQHFVIRCSAQPKDTNGNLGVPLKSKPVKIGNKNGICRVGHGYSGVLHSQPFVATLSYLNSSNTSHTGDGHNQLNIHVEIPHQDGMLPIISTLPIRNVQLLLSSSVYSQQHTCSNFLLVNQHSTSVTPGKTSGGTFSGFLKSNVSKDELLRRSGFQRPYQLNEELRGKEATTLYMHLDLQRCLWTFNAAYHMHELIDVCGGSIVTNFQVRDSTFKHVTVQVPLYVFYVYVTAPTGWASADHRTEMEFSFIYNSILGQNGLETSGTLKATLQVLRILINTDGQLVVEFKTKAKFRGMFVKHHRGLPSEKSKMFSTEHPDLEFDLNLVWSQDTFDGPTQIWKAISKYNLKDYTGNYVIELIPCTVTSKRSFQQLSDQEFLCTIHKIQRFKIPISFQQSPRPVPAIYSLNAIFQLLNSEDLFLSDPAIYQPHEIGYTGTFKKGQKVYGRVIWHPDQELQDVYQLRIDQVYLCTGTDGYVPTFDPTGSEYREGPQFGCIKPVKELKHRFLLLDRSNHDSVDMHFHNIPFKASFADALQRKSGIDGFHFLVDPLYKVESGHEWYLQVVYTILPLSQRWRKRRSVTGNLSQFLADETLASFLPGRQLSDSSIASKHNGTNMCLLQLSSPDESYGVLVVKDDQPSHDRSYYPLLASVISLLVILMVLITLGYKFWLKKYTSHNRHGLCMVQNTEYQHENTEMKMQRVVKMKRRQTRTKNLRCECTCAREIDREKTHLYVQESHVIRKGSVPGKQIISISCKQRSKSYFHGSCTEV